MIKTTIGKITTSCLGKMLDKEKNKGDYQPYLANINVRWGGFDLDNLSQMRFEPHEKERYEILDGDLIMCEGGEPGRCAIWRSELPSMRIQKALHRIRANCGTSIEYLYYWFLLAGKNHQLNKYFTGSTIKHLPGDKLKEIEIELPDYDSQEKIAAVLSCFDNKIMANDSVCSDLESMAKLLYDYWFVQFDFPDENGKPYKSSGGKMVWNEELKREIPDGWNVRSISDICDIVDCLHSKKPEYCFENRDCYLLTLENLTKEGHIDLSEKFYISRADYDMWTSKIELQEGDFVITNAGRAGDIGRIPKNVHCAIGRNLTAIRPKKISSIYLNMFLHSYYIQTQIMSNLDQGSFFTSFNVHAIKKLMVLVPNESMMETAIHKFTDIVNRIEELNAENQELASLRDFLLPMLMNGQVKVKEGETQ